MEITASDGSSNSDALAVAIEVTNVSGLIIGTPDPDDLLGVYIEEDVIQGLESNDTLQGGLGPDTMYGGAGDDTYYVDSGNTGDWTIEPPNEGIDTIVSSVSRILGNENLENLTLTGSAISGVGNTANNVITGNEADNVLYGLAGSDTLNGGAGVDTMYGGADNDVINGGSGADIIYGGTGADTMRGGAGDDTYYVDTGNAGDQTFELANEGVDTVISSVSRILGNANLENLVLVGGAVSGTGNSADNVITGNSASNQLVGLQGNDTLIGGGGNDIFYYASHGLGVDTITDFNVGDRINVHGLFGSFGALSGALSQNGADTVITVGATEQIILQGINFTNLHTNDFIF